MTKFFFLIIALLIFSGCAHVPTITRSNISSETPEQKTMSYEQYKEIVKPAGYVNTDNITIGELIGKKVILLDFVTYSCINCIRTFPYLNAWYDKYKDQGLEIIAIHTPEFAFEKKRENVAKAMGGYGIKFPIVLDNDYATWRAYGNNYWPRKYLIDIRGNIIYDHIGEGAYDETEKKIQGALAERSRVLGVNMDIKSDMANPQAEALGAVRSPEVYFGAERNELLGNGSPGQSGTFTFERPELVKPNILYLVGNWTITPEYAEAGEGAGIIFRYSAERVNIVAGADAEAVLKIERDGKSIGDSAGQHVLNNLVSVREHDLYEIIDDLIGAGEHTVEIKVESGKVRVYTLTFG